MSRNDRRPAAMALCKWRGAARSSCRTASAPCVPRVISPRLSTAGPSGCEVAVEHRFVDARQRLEIGDRALLVDLVHGLPDQSELEYRAVWPDEPRVRRPAGGRELAVDARDLAHGASHQRHERTGRRVEGFP